MKLSKIVFFVSITAMSFVLMGSQSSRLTQDEIEKIKAKYGLSTTTGKSSGVANEQTPSRSNAGDLAGLDLKKELQSTAELGKDLKEQLVPTPKEITGGQSVKNEIDDTKKLEELEKEEGKEAEEIKPGWFSLVFGFIPNVVKLMKTVTDFNKKAVDNLKRFNVTFKNVANSLASLDADQVLVPKKTAGVFSRDKELGAVVWEKVNKSDLSVEQLKTLKTECLYIVINEMVQGFAHLQPTVGTAIGALSYIAPNIASKSNIIFELASQYLPMIETLAKENMPTKKVSTPIKK